VPQSRKHGEALLFPQSPDPTRTAAGDDLLKVPVSPWVLHAPGSVVQGQARDDTAAPNAAARHSPRGCSSEVPGAHLMKTDEQEQIGMAESPEHESAADPEQEPDRRQLRHWWMNRHMQRRAAHCRPKDGGRCEFCGRTECMLQAENEAM